MNTPNYMTFAQFKETARYKNAISKEIYVHATMATLIEELFVVDCNEHPNGQIQITLADKDSVYYKN